MLFLIFYVCLDDEDAFCISGGLLNFLTFLLQIAQVKGRLQ